MSDPATVLQEEGKAPNLWGWRTWASRAKYGLVVFFYNFVDNLVPAKLGDLYAAHMARINFGIPRSMALGSLLFLRMVDGWIFLGLAAISSWILFSNQMPPLVFWALVFGVAFAVTASGVALGIVACESTSQQ